MSRRNDMDLNRLLSPSAPETQSAGPYSIRIHRVFDDMEYGFRLPSVDGGKHIFGPAVGPPGLTKGAQAFAFRTVEGEWFIVKPDMVV